MPDPLPPGEILKDMIGKKWRLGSSIGKGGFGEIYAAQEYNEASTRSNNTFPYVIKIEPHANGPLFVEMHFFMRNGKKSDIDMFMASKKLKLLGMPIYIGSGSHDIKDTKYRFVVMEKFGSDIWKIFLENKRNFNPAAVYKVGIQIIDVLEYIHSKGYVHADIKGANILLGLKNKNQVYLVDFGLAVHYTTSDKFKPDPKKAHDGTIEYLSIDAHHGVPTRRGDLEILIYNLIQWLGCTLPWEKDIKDPLAVKASKEKHMTDIPLFMKTCFGSETPPDAIINLLKYHNTLEFNSEINYDKVKNILEKGLQSTGGSLSSPLVFKVPKSPAKRKHNQETPLSGKKKKISRRKLVDSCTDDADDKENTKTDSESDLITEPPSHKSKTKNETPKRRGGKRQVKKEDPQEVEHVADEEDVDSDKTDGDTAKERRPSRS
ncbi:Protein kinase domain [Popillia japonica]|uniref:non-specific serine/threonine protein kinase n=1 Tax=Popillia japonica TaxID=7064 RepID=A0AAW1M3W6_POPJA